ncbi:FadR/GntR family transcriptional regulator [Nocardia sp. CDC160]|uniref:FadR/GntR family transcriptional regulator n=1 Tax=Nocardia sp. CDC160 TaxID=3112166 RepID=UPI002DBF8544|nr:FadR/GntR family transcriptional regulator [Nocardia sp. CDC160]MEC3918404.1 FadR/GntR family transcriptional regulator [Nocardia sp. CDC160]MEC3919141.1 FadR/GntR family transcriptional regulator [Nocardia sp. CDC160]
MSLEPLRRTPLVQMALRQLSSQLADGAWPVGSRIPAETELAAQLGVGRSTVREAITALVHLGMLESRQGRGTFVVSTTANGLETLVRRATVLEVYEVREAIELQAARLAAVRRTPDDLRRMDSALAERQQAEQRGKDEVFIAADLAFHRAVVAAAHNPLLDQIFGSLANTRLPEALRDLIDDVDAGPGIAGVSDAHVALAEAIRAGDPQAAAAATEANVTVTLRALRSLTT